MINVKQFKKEMATNWYVDFGFLYPEIVKISHLPRGIQDIVRPQIESWNFVIDRTFIRTNTTEIAETVITPTVTTPTVNIPETMVTMTPQAHQEHNQQPDSLIQENNIVLMKVNSELELEILALKKYKEDTKNIKSELDDALFWKADIEKKYQDALNIIQIQEERIKELEW